MKTLQLGMVIALAFLSGCIVVPGGPGRPRAVRSAVRGGCPPAHHWNGFACVHNGHGNGHGRGRWR